MTPREFITRFFVFAAVLFVLIAAFNVAVDPYLLFNAPRADGFNARKPSVTTHERLMKQYDSVRHPARTLILGSSRTGVGFNPESASWRDDDQPVYNLSLAGSAPQTLIHYLRHFLATRPPHEFPRTLFVGLDFESYLHGPAYGEPIKQGVPQVSETSLSVLSDGQKNEMRSLPIIKDYYAATVSLDAFLASLETVINSYRGAGASLDSNGWIDENVFLEASRSNGIAALFTHKNNETIRQYGSRPLALRKSADGTLQDVATIKELIEIAKSMDANLILFAQPAHVDRWEILERLGYWDDLEVWKRAVATLVDQARSSGNNVEFWDFASYAPQMQELPPPVDDRTTILDWFWEPAHYRSSLGDIMIATMRNPASAEALGERLTTGNVEERLAAIRADRDQFRHSHPDRVSKIAEMVCRATACDHAIGSQSH